MKGKLKQILLITDGCSNVGNDPIAVASMAKEYGITINVIGILDDNHLNDKGMDEIRNIAAAGGGIHQIVHSKALPKTVQMVTRKAMTQTIQQVVSKELKHILGDSNEVDSLTPEKRGKVVEVVEELGETLALDVLILVDISASMTNKLPSVREALRDLSVSLQSRMGDNQFSLWSFPGKIEKAEMNMNWSSQFDSIDKKMASISAQGTTPTGPALELALGFFMENDQHHREEEGAESNYALK